MVENMEENKVQRELMSEDEFIDHLSKRVIPLKLGNYNAVGRFKSVRRAIKRGHLTYEGLLIPSRPFHNRSNSCNRKKTSRTMNEEKKRIYASFKEYRNRHLND